MCMNKTESVDQLHKSRQVDFGVMREASARLTACFGLRWTPEGVPYICYDGGLSTLGSMVAK